jgi:ATPase subunit of ABC transporter with duplicated ATPase domains
MSSLVAVTELSYRTADGRPLFDNLSLAFGRERTGLVGRNGVGKTTLLRLILGELEPTAGSVSRRGRVGVLRQALGPPQSASVADLLGAAEPLARLERIDRGAGSEADLTEADWGLPARLDSALSGLGLDGLELSRPAASLSGGEATRAALAGLMAAEPDLLVLDEPTNNLDAEARALVRAALDGWRGGAVVVSHDRALLRGMDRIVELTSLGAQVYGGGWDLYAERKAEEAASLERELDRAERASAQVERDVQQAKERQARRDSAGRRARARGDAPKILLDAQAERAENSTGRASRLAERQREAAQDALAAARQKVERVRRLAFALPPSGLAAGKSVLVLEGAEFAHPGQAPLLVSLDLRITGPERVAVCGPNGAGKTTLLRLATGELEPTAGRVLRGVTGLALDQRTAILRDGETLLENYRRLNPAANDNAAYAALARFLFRADAALKSASALSGGERLRAALACVLAGERPPQLLILDEPTNHLDLDSIQAIEQALATYDGALLVVSHDEDFLAAIGIERRIWISPQRGEYPRSGGGGLKGVGSRSPFPAFGRTSPAGGRS